MSPNIELIRGLVREKGWSKSHLAMRMNVSRTEAGRLLDGKRVGGKKCIGGLMRAFPEVPLDRLFFMKDMEPKG